MCTRKVNIIMVEKANLNEKGVTSNIELGIFGFILSLMSLLLFWVPFLNFILAVAGLILCHRQISKMKTGLAIAGLVLGYLTLSFILIGLFILVLFMSALSV
jgi:hypothetical protein